MRLWVALLGGVVVIGAMAGSAAWYRQHQINAGHQAFLNNDYATTYVDLHPFDGWYSPQAETDLGDLYYAGNGVPQDYSKALVLFQKAATADYARSEANLGLIYNRGEGVPIDHAKAVYWLQRAANRGIPIAEWTIGTFYDSGNGLPHDGAQADAWYQKAADQGYADAQAKLGANYLSADGVQQDYTKAFSLLQKASDQGLPGAQYALGMMYENGWGVAQDNDQALSFFKEAASQGDDAAQTELGYLYFAGQNVPQDYAQANKYFKEAADQGNAEAEYDLGVDYLNAQGFTEDDAKAAALFQQAAGQNYASAQDALGKLYDKGKGVPKSAVLSYMYFNLAVAQGNAGSKDERDEVAAALTPEQIADAQSMSSKWTLGTPLPISVSYEDWAPDFVFDSSTTPDVYAATRIWFSREFTVGDQKKYAVFLVTKGDSGHADSANISVVTFNESVKPTDFNFGQNVQVNFTQSGSYGDVDPPKNSSALYTSPDRIATKEYNLGNDRFAVLVPDSYFGMGEGVKGYEIYVFSGGLDGQWSDIGGLTTGDDTTANCTPGQPDPGGYPCYAWTGTVEMVPATNGGWPEFIVRRHGAVLDANNKVIQASNQVYRYDGKKYSTPQ